MIDKEKGVIAKYKCGYCEKEFEAKAIKFYSDKGGKKSDGSNKVKCPKCGNFLKTWDDIVEVVKELKEGV